MNRPRITRMLALVVLICCAQAHAQEPSNVRSVPYRLTSESGEAIEMKVRYVNNYREVESVSFDITVRKSDGEHQYQFTANEGHAVLVTLTVAGNKVTAFTIDTDYRPAQAGEISTTLTLTSRSGEGLYFIYEWEGISLRNVRVDSERTSTRK